MVFDRKYRKLILLYNRFLKEIGHYSDLDLRIKTIKYMLESNDDDEGFYNYLLPFNQFEWCYTTEGELYWYRLCLRWTIFLLDTIKTDDYLISVLYNHKRWALVTDVSTLLCDFYAEFELDNETMKYYKKLVNIVGELKWDSACE